MEVFHGFTAMEAHATLDGFYPAFSSQKETKTLEDMWSMAFLSGISSDVEPFEEYFQQPAEKHKPVPPMEKVSEQPVYSPPMDSQDSFGEQWLIDLLPPDNAYSPPITQHQDYQSIPNAFSCPQNYQGGSYGGGVVPNEVHHDSYPSSPHSNSTLDGSDISDLLEIVEDLKTENSGMYSFSYSPPPQAVPELQTYPRKSTIQAMLTSPPAQFRPQPAEFTSFYEPQQPTTATPPPPPKAKDLGSLREVEKLLMSPLSVTSSSCAKKRSPSDSKTASKPLEKRLKKKEQNKNAALRYREKKRNEKNGLGLRQEMLEEENAKLKDQVDSLEREIGYLKDLLSEVQRRRM